MIPRHRRTFGFATAMVIVLIGLLAVILSAVATRATAEQRRTGSTVDAAQVSRLLAGAVQAAKAQSTDGRPGDGRIDSPLGEITLRWNGDRCEAIAGYRSVKRAVTLVFENGKLARVSESEELAADERR